MSTSNVFATPALIGALALACGAFYSAPASAADGYARTFYQNAGGSCHGIDTLNDAKLTRNGQRLMNKTTSSVDVVCNLMTDYSANYAANDGVITQVTLWARRYAGGASTMSCTLMDGYYGAPGSASYQPSGGNPVALPGSGQQAALVWKATDYGVSSVFRFLSPVNIRCTMPARTELNDWMVQYNDFL